MDMIAMLAGLNTSDRIIRQNTFYYPRVVRTFNGVGNIGDEFRTSGGPQTSFQPSSQASSSGSSSPNALLAPPGTPGTPESWTPTASGGGGMQVSPSSTFEREYSTQTQSSAQPSAQTAAQSAGYKAGGFAMLLVDRVKKLSATSQKVLFTSLLKGAFSASPLEIPWFTIPKADEDLFRVYMGTGDESRAAYLFGARRDIEREAGKVLSASELAVARQAGETAFRNLVAGGNNKTISDTLSSSKPDVAEQALFALLFKKPLVIPALGINLKRVADLQNLAPGIIDGARKRLGIDVTNNTILGYMNRSIKGRRVETAAPQTSNQTSTKPQLPADFYDGGTPATAPQNSGGTFTTQSMDTTPSWGADTKKTEAKVDEAKKELDQAKRDVEDAALRNAQEGTASSAAALEQAKKDVAAAQTEIEKLKTQMMQQMQQMQQSAQQAMPSYMPSYTPSAGGVEPVGGGGISVPGLDITAYQQMLAQQAAKQKAGLSTGAMIGIGLGAAALLGVGIWAAMRKR